MVSTTFYDQLASEQKRKKWEEQLKTEDFNGGHDILHVLTLVLKNILIAFLLFILPSLCLLAQQPHGGASCNSGLQEETHLEGKALEHNDAGPVDRKEVDRIIGKHYRDATELKDRIKTALKRESSRWETEIAELQKAVDDERAVLQRKFIRCEDERAALGRDPGKAEENRNWLEADRRHEEREWKSRFDDQEQRVREMSEAIAKSEEQTIKLKSELDAMKWSNSALSRQFNEEYARFQRELSQWGAERMELKKGLSKAEEVRKRLEADALTERANHEKWHRDRERVWQTRFDDQALVRWADEGAELKKCLDDGRKVQMRVEEDVPKETGYCEKLHREEMEQIIATHEEEMVGLEFEHGMMKRHNDALRHEYEEEWARSQLRLAPWANERAELKKCLDEARKVQMRVEEDVAKEIAFREKLHREEVERIIAIYEEERAGLEFEHGMMKRHNDALRHEYEEEWVRSQLRLARREALEAQRKAEANATKEREHRQKIYQNQEVRGGHRLSAKKSGGTNQYQYNASAFTQGL